MATQIGGYTPPPIAGSSGATPAPSSDHVVRYTTTLDGNAGADEFYSRFTIDSSTSNPLDLTTSPTPTATAAAVPTPTATATPAVTPTASASPTAGGYTPTSTANSGSYNYPPQIKHVTSRTASYTPPVQPYNNRTNASYYNSQQPPTRTTHDVEPRQPVETPPPVEQHRQVVVQPPVVVLPEQSSETQPPVKHSVPKNHQPITQPLHEDLAVAPDGSLYNNNPQEGPIVPVTNPLLGSAGPLIPSNVASSLLNPAQIAALGNPILPIPTASGHGHKGSHSGGDPNNWTQDLYSGILSNYFGGEQPSTNGITDTAGLQFTSGY